jgi:hypothetical protein
MKHQISFRALIALVSVFTFVFTLCADGQSILKNKSSVTWGLGFGSGSYTGIGLYQNGLITTTAPGTFSFSMFATTFRLLLATNMLDSRLSLGVEYNLQQVGEGVEGIIINREAPDPMIHSVVIVGNYLAARISDDVSINAAGGLGILFFANMATRIEFNQGMGFPQTFNDAKAQLAGSAMLLAPIRVQKSFTIDPEIRLLASAGEEKVLIVQFLVGLTYCW